MWIYRITYFPTVWKYSEVVVILKANKLLDCQNSNCPISLLPSFFKLFDKIFLYHLISLALQIIVDTPCYVTNDLFQRTSKCLRHLILQKLPLESSNTNLLAQMLSFTTSAYIKPPQLLAKRFSILIHTRIWAHFSYHIIYFRLQIFVKSIQHIINITTWLLFVC